MSEPKNEVIDLERWKSCRDDDLLAVAISKRWEGLPLTQEERHILAAWDAQA